jgi:hypothetical protein
MSKTGQYYILLIYDSASAPTNISQRYWALLMELSIKTSFDIRYNAAEPWIVDEKPGNKSLRNVNVDTHILRI